ncbi:large ribosomal subunit protein uL5 [Candidatus Vidania fulgoroideorum]
MIPYIKKLYFSKLFSIKRKLNIKNLSSIPVLKKIVLNQGLGILGTNTKYLKENIQNISLITGQKPILIKAKKSVSNFKIRKGNIIALKVTLRNSYMYDFIYRFINLSAPRIRDFNGFSIKSFDSFGNYNFGINDNSIFPEIIDINSLNITGYNISIIINSKSIEHSIFLLKEIGFPIK